MKKRRKRERGKERKVPGPLAGARRALYNSYRMHCQRSLYGCHDIKNPPLGKDLRENSRGYSERFNLHRVSFFLRREYKSYKGFFLHDYCIKILISARRSEIFRSTFEKHSFIQLFVFFIFIDLNLNILSIDLIKLINYKCAILFQFIYDIFSFFLSVTDINF